MGPFLDYFKSLKKIFELFLLLRLFYFLLLLHVQIYFSKKKKKKKKKNPKNQNVSPAKFISAKKKLGGIYIAIKKRQSYMKKIK